MRADRADVEGYSGAVNWTIGPWWALIISVVGGLVVVTLLSVGIIALTGFGEM